MHPITELRHQIPFTPYERNASHGVTSNLLWRGEVVAQASHPPTSMCVGAVYQLLHMYLQQEGYEKVITIAEMKQLLSDVFIDDYEGQKTGVQLGLLRLQIGEIVSSPSEALPGDFAQIWDFVEGEEKPYFGHSMMILGETVNGQGKPARKVWSSDNLEATGNFGHGEDYFSDVHPREGKRREWFIARLTV